MSNIAAESLLLSCFVQFPDAFFGVADFMSEEDFEHEGHQMVFLTLKSLYLEKEADKLSKVKLIAEAKSLGFETFKSVTQDYRVLDQVLGNTVQAGDVNGYFQDVKRLSIIRTYEVEFSRQRKYLRDTRDDLTTVIGNIEEAVFNVPDLVDHGQHGIISLAKDAEQIISELAETPGQVGLDVGLPVWQNRIGQIRNGGVTFVVATAKCVAGNTKIYMPDNGSHVNICDLKRGDRVASFVGDQTIKPRKVSAVNHRGLASVIRLKTESGYLVDLTNDHKVLREDGEWVEVSQLVIGDHIRVARNLFSPNTHTNDDVLPELSHEVNSDTFFDQVTSLDEAGECDVWDVTVAGDENFVGNNIILHNCGKSQLGLGRGIYVAHKLNLPVLLCDSELSKNEQVIRLVGMMAHIPYHVLETGYWKLSPDELKAEGIPDSELSMYAEYKQRMMDRQFWDRVSKLPIDYISVSGLPMEEVLPRLRRWVMTHVKPHVDAKFPECLIIYDYIKLTSFDELRGGKLGEYQVHGFNMMALHEFCKRHNVPVLAFGQTNRELDTDFNCIAGAKRIMDNVTSATLLKAKTEEEIGFDPIGNHFLRVFGARFGPATPCGHVNINFDKSNGSIEELGYASMDFAAKRAEKLEAWKKSKGKRKRDDDWDDDDD